MSEETSQDAIVCAIYKYSDYSIVEPWINSIRKTDFNGDIAIVAINIPEEMIARIEHAGVVVYECNDTSATHPNVLRFKYISEYLKTKSYSKIVLTDARDVVFQANPFNYLYAIDQNYAIVSSSENILIKDEPWMKNNLISTFGNEAYETLKDTEALCAGVIAGNSTDIATLCDEIFIASGGASANTSNTAAWNEHSHWSTWSKDPADQAAYNVILRNSEWANRVKVCGIDEDWNINIGVSEYNNSSVLINPNGVTHGDIVKNYKGQLFHIVHQYDRIYQLKTSILKKYVNG